MSDKRTMTVPALAPETPLRLPEWAESTLPNGLHVILVRRPSVPLAELRLSIPAAHADPAVAHLTVASMFSGTEDSTMARIAQRVQAVGGSVRADVDPDKITISGNGLAAGLPELLSVLGEIVANAVYPEGHFETQRARTADRLSVAEQKPDFQVARILEARLWSGHPYGRRTPSAAEAAKVERETVVALHRSLMQPYGAQLVIVGDFDLDQAAASVDEAFRSWTGTGHHRPMTAPPRPRPGPIALADRPGSVQSSIRIACPAVDRTHPDNAAQHLADVVYGGYAVARLVMNLRETKGFGYSVRSNVSHMLMGSVQVTSVDVATEATLPALIEIFDELRGMADRPPDDEELELARGYALGSIKLGITTQSGIAGRASGLAMCGLGLTWLAELFDRLREVTPDDVRRVAAERMDPGSSVAVILADSGRVSGPLAAVGELEHVER